MFIIICLISIRDSKQGTKISVLNYRKGIAQLTIPRNLSPVYSCIKYVWLKVGLKTQTFVKKMSEYIGAFDAQTFCGVWEKHFFMNTTPKEPKFSRIIKFDKLFKCLKSDCIYSMTYCLYEVVCYWGKVLFQINHKNYKFWEKKNLCL